MDANRIEARLAALERTCSRQRRLLLATVSVLVAGVSMSPAKLQGPVEAPRFVVVDEQGVERASLGLVEDTVALFLRDGNGTVQAGLALSSGKELASIPVGSPLLFLGERGHPLASLAVQPSPSGEPGATLLLGPETGVFARLGSHGDGAALLFAGTGPGGIMGLVVHAMLHAASGKTPRLVLRDGKGELLFTTDPEQREYGGSSHYAVQNDDDARAAVEEEPRKVDCGGPGVTDRTLELLARIPDIEGVILRGCRDVTGRGLAALARSGRLRSLHLLNCRGLDGADFGFLRGCPLEYLGILGIRLDDAGLESLAALTSLKELTVSVQFADDIRPEPLSADSLSKLAALQGLETLRIGGYQVPDEAVAELRERLPNTDIQVTE